MAMALLSYNLFKSIGESDTLKAFITARTNHFKVAEISEEYRMLQGKRMKYKECLKKLMMEMPGEQEKDLFYKHGRKFTWPVFHM
jgi:hypothetical protein